MSNPMTKYITQPLAKIAKHSTLLVCLTISGALLGFVYAQFFPQQYKATTMIGIEEEKAAGFESLMAQFGLDAGGLNPGGIFEGESLITLFKMRHIVESALRSSKSRNTQKTQSLAERFYVLSDFKDEAPFLGQSYAAILKNSRLADTLHYVLFKALLKKHFAFDKPDKKQSFIYVSCSHQDPELASDLTVAIVHSLSNYYTTILKEKVGQNLEVLQLEADSLRYLLNKRLVQTAVQSDLNVNPNRQTLGVDKSKSMVDLQITINMYGEILKQLKLAEISLKKQNPLIQILDYPKFPFEKSGLPTWQIVLLGAVLGAALTIYLALRNYTHD